MFYNTQMTYAWDQKETKVWNKNYVRLFILGGKMVAIVIACATVGCFSVLLNELRKLFLELLDECS
ncbi:MAG: hypothetical protein EBZ49_00345 [Proteobacteria bacterium]|nr:hypothetical protein [Pseudomonadota bacterium]